MASRVEHSAGPNPERASHFVVRREPWPFRNSVDECREDERGEDRYAGLEIVQAADGFGGCEVDSELLADLALGGGPGVSVLRIDPAARERHVAGPGVAEPSRPLDEQNLRVGRGRVQDDRHRSAAAGGEKARPVRRESGAKLTDLDRVHGAKHTAASGACVKAHRAGQGTMHDHADFFSAVTALGSIERLDVDAMRFLFRVECSGEDFYNGIADRIGNAEAAELLRRNAREERGHAERVRRAIAAKLGRPFESPPEDLERYPIQLPEAIPLELLPLIVQGEIDGDHGYQRWADGETDPEVQRLLRLNGREETVHGERVQQVMRILEASRAGG